VRCRKAASGRAPKPSENERRKGCFCAYRRPLLVCGLSSLRLLPGAAFASCASPHVIASLRGRIRRPGATCTAAKTCPLSHSDTDRIFDSLSVRHTFSALTFPSQRSRFNGQSGSWQSYGLSDD
jgi:hypothetical protein